MRPAHLTTVLALGALVTLLAGCLPTTSPSLHEVYLFGTQNTRLTYAYGAPASLTIGGREVSLTVGRSEDPLQVLSAALMDGEPYLQEDIEGVVAPARVQRIPLTTDLLLTVEQPILEVVYFDGDNWFTLSREPQPGLSARVIPVPRVGRMRGLGQLTREEADALASALEGRDRPFALYLLPEEGLDRRVVNGLEEHLLTGLFLDEDLDLALDAFQPAPRTVQWETLGSGGQAGGVDETSYYLVRSRVEFIELWTRAHAADLSPPPLPDIDFAREVVVAIFLGERPTGGYGLQVDRVDVEDDDLFVNVVESVPAAGSVVTQALTSPWIMLRVLRGGINVAWFRDPETGALVGVARAGR